jgi:two-component system CheB/CheR fusion protein
VIPPGKSLAALDGELRLADLPATAGHHVAVDLFFRTLADTYGPHATAIVLSGADGDGAIGIRRIKERGGLSIAQDPNEAEHDGMPRSAIATGVVDLVLPVAEMAARLVAYHRLEHQLELPLAADEHGPAGPAAGDGDDHHEVLLRQILELVRHRTGHDFQPYKRSTVLRRIARRMQVNQTVTLPDYLEVLRTRPGEARGLQKDLLVSVTNFFRDSSHFEALATLVPSLFEGKSRHDTVRVWVAGCATGEEAYSIAILLQEFASRLDRPPRLRVFASDLDTDAIRFGRAGFYPPTIAADVSAERLDRFFSVEPRGYRVSADLRETVLFATHDVLKDSPFSRIDLVSCRNVLIYLDHPARQRTLEIFHFALRLDGLLFLGSSESVGEAPVLFEVVDEKHCLFRRRPYQHLAYALPIGATGLAREAGWALDDVVPPIEAEAAFAHAHAPGQGVRVPTDGGPDRAGQVHLRLIERYSPPSLVVDAEFEVLHLSQRAGRYLRFGGGEPSRNLLRIAHPQLAVELRAALNRVAQTGKPTEVLGLPVDLDGRSMLIDLSVAPADEIAPQCLLVVFNERPAPSGPDAVTPPAPRADGSRERELYEEVVRLKMQLRDIVEQHQASREELQAGNEELQAMNEDLRSAGAELDARRQEAQSVNEELATVGVELRRTVEEVGASNSDLHNLMESMAIAMVFLDRERRITFYTPSAVALFNLIATDIGRPLADLAQRLDYPGLDDDANSVLQQLVPIEREVGDPAGRWFVARLQPYRTVEDRIAGVVLTFTDITERRRRELALIGARDALASRVELLEATLAGMPDRVLAFDRHGRVLFANPEACRHWGLDAGRLDGCTVATLGGPPELVDVLERQLRRSVDAGQRISGTVGHGRAPLAQTTAFTFSPVMAGDGSVRLVVGWLRETAPPPEALDGSAPSAA